MTILPASEWSKGGFGVFADVPDADYFEYPAVSNSILSGRTPAHMKVYSEGGRKDTPALRLGRAWHAGVLRPMDFVRRYGVAQTCSAELKSGGACSNTGKARYGGSWYCGRHEPDGPADLVEPVSPADLEAILKASEVARAMPGVRERLDLPGGFEVSLRWEDAGVPCKARLDFLSIDGGVVVDYKTARDASPFGFARAAANLRYNRQQAWYTRGCEALGIPIFEFSFLAQEKEPPYAAGLYTLPGYAVLAGLHEAAQKLTEYTAAKESDRWPAYTTNGPLEIEWPAWSDNEFSELEEEYAY